MARISDSTLLDLWEQGACEHPLDRALGLLAQLGEGRSRSALAALPIAERDRRLFAVAEAIFGPELALMATCRSCSAETELTFAVADIMALDTPADARRVLSHGGRDHGYRMPDSRDIAQALQAPDPHRALLLSLLGRAEAPEDLLKALDVALTEAAGLETLSLTFDCVECGAGQEAPFDILDYIWRRISAEARRLMWDIHLLARAYGWTSGEILALSPLRRAEHVAMVSA
ncbi:hypothetical protein AB2B41_11340 [Marimonas sp. MJW-29]|uniref:Uncharacterized protein n=1 Tax=Sulfitobacter sediminis TaxID=3234186 RepID=A0ABV3RQ45_9RHOB